MQRHRESVMIRKIEHSWNSKEERCSHNRTFSTERKKIEFPLTRRRGTDEPANKTTTRETWNNDRWLAVAARKSFGGMQQKDPGATRNLSFEYSEVIYRNSARPVEFDEKFRRESTTVKWLHVFTLSSSLTVTRLAVPSAGTRVTLPGKTD